MAIPTPVQHVSASSTYSATVGASGVMKVPLPNGAQAGNCLILGGNFGTSTAVTVTDDKGNTWTAGPTTFDTTKSQNVFIFYALNVAAGTRVISVKNNNGSAISNMQIAVSEFMNVATASAADGSGANFGVSATPTSGSFTPGTSGDLLWYYVAPDASPLGTSSFTAGSQSGITWALLSADLQDGQAVQYGIQSPAAAINPQLTMGTSDNFCCAAIALKSASAGSAAPAGITVNRIEHISLFASGHGGPGYSTPTTVQFPCAGNLLIAAVASGGSGSISGITDSNGNTWVKAGSGEVAAPHNLQIYYAANATPGATLVLTITSSASTIDSTVILYDVSGAAASPYDVSSGTSGLQTTNVATLSSAAIVPTTANGLIISVIQQEFDTENGVSAPAAGLFDSVTYGGESLDGPENCDQNGGWAHFYNPDTASRTFTWTFLSSTDPMQNWASFSAAFKGGGAAVPGWDSPTAGPSYAI
jgi:hypothetical protein